MNLSEAKTAIVGLADAIETAQQSGEVDRAAITTLQELVDFSAGQWNTDEILADAIAALQQRDEQRAVVDVMDAANIGKQYMPRIRQVIGYTG